MTSKIKTSDIDKAFYTNYLKRAEECFNAAQTSSKNQEWNSATISAIHSCISACDAMCVYFLGKRPAGQSHNDAVTLFSTIDSTDEISTNANRLSRILGIKNMAEYEERLIFRAESEKILKDCERFLAYVKKKLP
jgi:uncharacterized protein (UPF0332 family)